VLLPHRKVGGRQATLELREQHLLRCKQQGCRLPAPPLLNLLLMMLIW
jgi:hypothetical protein